MDRRDFLASLAVSGLAACGAAKPTVPPLPPGELQGVSMDLGHRLRNGAPLLPGETERVPVLIVGGGIGGLSAGWRLAKAGFKDFLLVELESATGGNSRCGRNEVSDYPLAAHYLPLPTREAIACRELLAELGVLQGDPQAARPRYDERYLCATPQERLFRRGRWEEGILPQFGVSRAERQQYRHFHELMEHFKQRVDGHRRAFALPMALSSDAADLQALDQVNMRDWLLAQGLDSPHLHWYVDYACRDDFGTTSAATSAWAGAHYFACRNGEAQDAASDTVLTTPGGNAWLAEGLERLIHERVGKRILTSAVAVKVSESDEGMVVDLWLVAEKRSLRIIAEQLIWAAPLFLVPHVFDAPQSLREAARGFSYAPWLVANLSVAHFPMPQAGAEMAWDNVLYDSPGLGYVVSTHQQMRLHPQASVLTYYRVLSQMPPAEGRALLLTNSRAVWAEQVFADLERAHADIRQITTRLDIFRNAHAMIRPLPGLIWGPARRLFAADGNRLRFAHADVSGFSLFEEAQYRGVVAAERTLRRLGRAIGEPLA